MDPRNNSTIHLVSESAEQTTELGLTLAAMLRPGDVVSLSGDLGAGKTALTRGIADGLGCQVPVASPTFTLVMEHPASGKGIALYHFDVYRLGGPEEFLELGLDEYFDRDGVCVIEWGSQIDAVLPVSTLRILIRLTSPEMPDQRVLTCLWPGREQDLAWLEGSIADADARI